MSTDSAPGPSDWRSTMSDPCTCSPGDGTQTCPREDECQDAYFAFQMRAKQARAIGALDE